MKMPGAIFTQFLKLGLGDPQLPDPIEQKIPLVPVITTPAEVVINDGQEVAQFEDSTKKVSRKFLINSIFFQKMRKIFIKTPLDFLVK